MRPVRVFAYSSGLLTPSPRASSPFPNKAVQLSFIIYLGVFKRIYRTSIVPSVQEKKSWS